MKQLLFTLGFLMTLTLSACSGDDDINTSDELSGTVWSQTEGLRTDTIYFAINKKCVYSWKIEGWKPLKSEWRYVFQDPVVTIDAYGLYTYKGRIENGVLYIRVESKDLELKRIR